VAVHWYGGLNTKNLQKAHEVDPTKSILGSEACNCVGHVVLQQDGVSSWWTRAERLSLDILEDLKWWAVGWIDWNLLVDVNGGPNHLKNLCDANMIQDAAGEKGGQPLIKQASYYYMGHFSRYLVPGAKRVQVSNTVEVEIPQVTAADIKNGAALLFEPCDAASAVQQFRFATASLIADKIAASLIANGTDDAPGSDGYQRGGECVELCIMPGCWFPKVQLWACGDGGEADHGGRGNQKWDVQSVSGGVPRRASETRRARVRDASTERRVDTSAGEGRVQARGARVARRGGGEVKGCLTAVKAEGWAVDLDAGLEVIAAQLAPCLSDGTSNQTFLLGGDGEGGRCTLERCEEAPLTCPAVHRGGRVAAGEFLHGWDGRCEALPRASGASLVAAT